ncbi:hypothetical protein [Legionella shakespearei]|nr:hypothetical protein [Legionella shakespearei]
MNDIGTVFPVQVFTLPILFDLSISELSQGLCTHLSIRKSY